MEYIKSQIELQNSSDTRVICYITGSHAGYLTYDGIDVNGKRICDEILAETKRIETEKTKVVKFSMVGYSLGGLISRYAVGYLQSIGYFDEIQPVNFTTFCTPHVGVLNPGKSWGTRLYNYCAPFFLAHTGMHIFLTDKKKNRLPLLVWMSDKRSVFFKALKNFKNLALYSNVINDKRTSWYTSAISSRDPFSSMVNENASAYALEFVEGYGPNVVDISKPVKFKGDVNDNEQELLNRGKRSVQRKLKWARILINTVKAIIFTPLFVFYLIGLTIFERLKNWKRVTDFFSDTSNNLVHLYKQIEATDNVDTVQETERTENVTEQEYLMNDFEREFSEKMRDETDTIVESVFSAMNSDSYKDYHLTTSHSATDENNLDLVNLKGKSQTFDLELVDDQVTIIDNLNSLNWKKFPMLIRKTKQTHRAAIFRNEEPTFSEGIIIVKHFVNEIFEY